PPLTEGAALFEKGLEPLLVPGRHKLIGCTRRTQGLIVAAANPLALHGLADCAARRARFAWRQDGSATHLLTQHLLRQAGLEARALVAARSTEDSHNAVAAAVAGGLADAGIGLEAAARAFGLGFVALAEDDYFLVCLADALEQPPVLALRRALQDPAWQQAVAALPGYRVTQPGKVLSLTRALPWWNFRKSKATPRPRIQCGAASAERS
ncbi:MAG: substrate-binding domain-containing protein, partial [Burkholderiales bacterium]|nr:substrate-binding domain-containing protein [Burkholderiales bacterium]